MTALGWLHAHADLLLDSLGFLIAFFGGIWVGERLSRREFVALVREIMASTNEPEPPTPLPPPGRDSRGRFVRRVP